MGSLLSPLSCDNAIPRLLRRKVTQSMSPSVFPPTCAISSHNHAQDPSLAHAVASSPHAIDLAVACLPFVRPTLPHPLPPYGVAAAADGAPRSRARPHPSCSCSHPRLAPIRGRQITEKEKDHRGLCPRSPTTLPLLPPRHEVAPPLKGIAKMEKALARCRRPPSSSTHPDLPSSSPVDPLLPRRCLSYMTWLAVASSPNEARAWPPLWVCFWPVHGQCGGQPGQAARGGCGGVDLQGVPPPL